jgi:hypothetical protein
LSTLLLPMSACREAFPAIVSCYASLAQRIAGIARSSAAESNGSGSSSPAARTGPKGACIDEEIFAATVCVMAQGMLRMDLQQLQQQFDMRALAADVGSLVAITNTFLSQPWKQWGYLACPALCRVRHARVLTSRHAAAPWSVPCDTQRGRHARLARLLCDLHACVPAPCRSLAPFTHSATMSRR